MFFSAYSALNIASTALVAGLGAVIAAVHIPARSETQHYRTARTYLSVAFILLALLKLAEIIAPKDSDNALTGCIALIVAAYQAMCFTASLLLFIRPQWVTKRRMVPQFAVITALAGALITGQVLLSHKVYLVLLGTCSALYVALLAYYTYVFRSTYRQFVNDLYEFYLEEDLNHQLRWIAHTFYSSLVVGMLVFLSITGRQWLDGTFIIIYSAFYIYLTASFINYGQYVSTVMRAVRPAEHDNQSHQAADTAHASHDYGDGNLLASLADTPMKYAVISEALKKWVDEQKFLYNDVAVKDIAKELGTTLRHLNDYFREVVGEDFVKWRVRLRVRYACHLLQQDPNRSITEVANESGFGDRSYFYRKFAELQGITVAKFKRQAILNLAKQSSQPANQDMSQS
ncbi:MAG: AraC family transcriptional regulator [Muribaculaceae bacterium]|nr:AraC family transcriptional regulator [Muribaculaceae bacterium]